MLGFCAAVPVFRLANRNVATRASSAGDSPSSEPKKTRKKSSASKSSAPGNLKSSASREKKQDAGDADETPKKKTRTRRRIQQQDENAQPEPEAGSSSPPEQKPAPALEPVEYAYGENDEADVETEEERRRRVFPPKAESMWKKPFPWLGREFEETFVKPRNEPNPLVCCFGETINEFVPSVRVCPVQMDEDAYSSWKGLQWTCPEFARTPGTNPANVAISIARLEGKPAFIGKVGDDEHGKKLLELLRENKVDTRGVKIDPVLPTGLSRGKVERLGKRRMSFKCEQQSAENTLDISEVDMDILKESKLFHFSALSLTTEKMRSTVMSAVEAARGFGNVIFFDVNLPLPFWISRDEAWSIMEKAWTSSDVIKINKVELEFLIEDEGLAKRKLSRDTVPKSFQEALARNKRYEYHYTLEDIAPIWRDNIKILLVTDGTYRIHYYTPKFHGDVLGTEDVIIAASTCDRTGSGDALAAAMIRKLTAQPDIFEDQDRLERALRFAISAGVIAQWTIGAVRCFPTESAAQNLTEQMFPFTQI